MDTAAVPGWNNVDAVMISGSQETPTGLVLPQASKSHPNRVLYEPLPGIHGSAIDSFTYVLSAMEPATGTSTLIVAVAASPEVTQSDRTKPCHRERSGIHVQAASQL